MFKQELHERGLRFRIRVNLQLATDNFFFGINDFPWKAGPAWELSHGGPDLDGNRPSMGNGPQCDFKTKLKKKKNHCCKTSENLY